MNPERWKCVKHIFSKTLDLPEAERQPYLDQACGEDPNLRREVDRLLRLHDESSDFLSPPPGSPPSSFPENEGEALVGQRIGQYEIVRFIAAGGMGAVYEARQESPQRRVALKIIRPGLVGESILRRFEYEAEVLGLLQHPGIARIYEAGTFDLGPGPRPFFAMELVEGLPLLEYASEQTLNLRQRLELFTRIIEAVQHAHQKGVIHRDLKPTNILVDPDGQPKILDFGVARATDSDLLITTMHTSVGELVGTVRYMSPEQIEGDPDQLDIRSDVYALGLLGYELISGRQPYDLQHKLMHEAMRIIREDDPTPLSTVNKSLGGDLDTILAKALAKEKDRRYSSATEFAADINRYLHDEPVFARTPSTWYQMRKFTRRNRVLVGGIAATFLALLIGLIVSLYYANDAFHSTRQSRFEGERYRAVNEFLTLMFAELDPEHNGREVPVGELIDRSAQHIGAMYAGNPRGEAAVRLEVGQIYEHLGLDDRAARHYIQARALWAKHLGPDHPDTLTAMHRLARIRLREERLVEAESLLRTVIESRTRMLGAEDYFTLEAQSDLGRVLQLRGALPEAESLLRRTLSMQEQHLNGSADARLITLAHLARTVNEQGNPAEASQMSRRIITGWSELVEDPHHPDILRAEALQGKILADLEKWDETESLLARAVAGLRDRLGEVHPDTLAATLDLAHLHLKREQFPEATATFRAVADGWKDTRGPHHPAALEAEEGFGLAAMGLKNYPLAESSFRRAAEGFLQIYGPTDIRTLRAQKHLDESLLHQNRPLADE